MPKKLYVDKKSIQDMKETKKKKKTTHESETQKFSDETTYFIAANL